jgi:cohesin complex subunit SCC1
MDTSALEDTLNTPRRKRAGSVSLLDDSFNNSQYLQHSLISPSKRAHRDDEIMLEDDLGIELDFGEDLDRSVELGRDAPTALDDFGESRIDVFGKGGDDTTMIARHDDDGPAFNFEDDDIHMGGQDITLPPDEGDLTLTGMAPLPCRGRISESPLSDIDPDVAADLENSRLKDNALFNPNPLDEESTLLQTRAPQRQRKLKLIKPDADTIIPTSVIKAQQNDHSKIMKRQELLPRDPVLFTLSEMQKNGGFAENVLGDLRASNWAPQLRGLLSLDAVMQAMGRKRTRDEVDSDAEEVENASKSPRVASPEAARAAANADADLANGTILDLGDNDALVFNDDVDAPGSRPVSRSGLGFGDDLDDSAIPMNFDDTTAPILHPADAGPVSQGTTHAVHLLRDVFADSENSPDKRRKNAVVFQDLLPEARTTKEDATKMFFEILVLATKDAIKVEQKTEELGGAIRVRAKRGLWGAWAEREAGGEIASGGDENGQREELADMDRLLAQARTVAASA